MSNWLCQVTLLIGVPCYNPTPVLSYTGRAVLVKWIVFGLFSIVIIVSHPMQPDLLPALIWTTYGYVIVKDLILFAVVGITRHCGVVL